MRLLFFNQYYHPDLAATGQYLTEMAEELARRHIVSVVTAYPSYSAGDRRRRSLRQLEVTNGVRVWRTFSTRFNRRRLWGRACNYVSYLISSFYGGLRAGTAEVVVAKTDPPPIGLVAWAVARLKGARFVQIFTDVYPEVSRAAGQADHPLISWGLARLTSFLLGHADRTVALGEMMRRLLLQKGGAAERMSVIADWADADEIGPVAAPDNLFLREEPGLAGKFIVMHSGNMGVSQDLTLLLQVAERLRPEPGITVVLIGDGAARPDLEEIARARGLNNVRFLPYQPRARLAHSLSAAGVHFVSLKPGFEGAIVPCKIYGILAAARPVVAAVSPESELHQIVSASQAGFIFPDRHPEKIADCIKKLNNDRSLARELGLKGRAFLCANYEKKKALQAYETLFGQLADKPRSN